MQTSDYELITNCLNGDKDCFSELVVRYKKLVYSIVYKYFKDKEDLYDTSQEVFIRIYKSLDKYNPQYKFSTWCIRIATNLCLDMVRKKKITQVCIDEYENMASDNDTPESSYLSRENSTQIRQAISRLPEKYKTLIILYHQKGMSYKEMSDTLKKPMSIIKNRLFRARHILREALVEIGT